MNSSKKEPGYVYILTNPGFREDWVKIGKSSRPVDVRSKELDNTAVRQAVNEAIDKHDLSPDETLCMFSRLAASYIHTMQSSCPDANSRDAVEDLFLDMLDKYLALLDTQEVKDAMEREKRLKMN